MKNKRNIPIVLTICLLFTNLFTTASAVESSIQKEVLGGINMESGYLVLDDSGNNNMSRAIVYPHLPGNPTAYEIFSIEGREVTQLLVSKQGLKSFGLGTLPSNAKKIICEAKLYHSLAEQTVNASMSCGVCHFDANRQIYVSDMGMDAEHGEIEYQTFTISGNLSSGVTYYSYIKNEYPTGYVWGDLTIYYTLS